MDKINISGIAVRAGLSRNNRKYLANELNKFAPTLIGRPILRDHEGKTENVIGKITHAESIDNGNAVKYKGWIKGKEDIERIKDGRISEVSIGAFSKRLVKDKEDENIIIPIDMEALEMSTTPVPGVIGTSITAEENYNEEEIKKMITDYDKEQKSISHSSKDDYINKKEENMESEKNSKESAIVDNSAELKIMKEELEAMKEKTLSLEKDKLALEDARKLDAIKTYKEKANAKGLTLKDFSNASMETIQMAIEMVNELPEPKSEKDEDEDEELETEKVKTKAMPKSQEVISKTNETFGGYVVTTEDVNGRGVAFFKYY